MRSFKIKGKENFDNFMLSMKEAGISVQTVKYPFFDVWSVTVTEVKYQRKLD